MNKRNLLIGAVVAVLAVAVAVFVVYRPGTPGKSDEVIRIGVILPLTGPTAFLGDFVKNGLTLAVEDLKSEDAIDRTIQLVFLDSKNDPKEGVAAFQKLMLEKPAAIIVAMSSVARAVAPLSDSERMPLFATMVSSADATVGHEFMFRLFINADIDARLMAEFAAKTRKFSRVAIASVNDEMGLSFSRVFTNTYTANGGAVPIHETFDKSTTDFRDIAAKIRSVSPDAIYLLGYDKNLGQLAKELRQQGLDQPLLSIATIAQEPVREIAGSALENTYFTSVSFNADSPLNERARTFVKNYEKRFRKKPTYFSAFAYDTLLLIEKAIDRDGFDADSIVKALKSIEGFEGTTGKITFEGTRDAVFPMKIKEIKGGTITPVD